MSQPQPATVVPAADPAPCRAPTSPRARERRQRLGRRSRAPRQRFVDCDPEHPVPRPYRLASRDRRSCRRSLASRLRRLLECPLPSGSDDSRNRISPARSRLSRRIVTASASRRPARAGTSSGLARQARPALTSEAVLACPRGALAPRQDRADRRRADDRPLPDVSRPPPSTRVAVI